MNRIFKYSVLLAVTGMTLLAQQSNFVFPPRPVNPRKMEIGKTPVLTLCKDGVASVEVVCEAKNGQVQQAAYRLAKYLGIMLDCKVPIRSAASGKGVPIFVGPSSLAKQAGLDASKLDADGFFIKTIDGKIVILGCDSTVTNFNRTGTLFGVYDFLERFCGVRFFFSGPGTILPKHRDLSVPEIDIYERPDLIMRYPHTKYCGKAEVKLVHPDFYQPPEKFPGEQAPSKYLRESELTPHLPHGMCHLDLPRRFAKEHPEYFALRKGGKRMDGSKPWSHPSHSSGMPCFSSEGLKNELYLDCEAVLLGKPLSTRNLLKPLPKRMFSTAAVGIMPPDGLVWCMCPECAKCKTPQQKADKIWRFYMDIAQRLQDNKVPGSFLVYGYSEFHYVPDKSIKIPSNVVFQLAHGSDWAEKLPEESADYAKVLKDWHERMGHPIFAWIYHTKVCIPVPFLPNATPHTTGRFLKKHLEHYMGIFWESENDRWIYSALDSYIMAKLSWDTSLDPEALLDEYFKTMFGPASGQMKDFYQALENNWLSILNKMITVSYGPIWSPLPEYEIWGRIYSTEEIARLEKLLVDAKKLLADAPEMAEKVDFIRQQLWEPVLDRKKHFERMQQFDSIYEANVPQAKAAIVMDGRLDSKEWSGASEIWLVDRNYQPTEVNTSIKLLQDAENFYFGVRAEEPYTNQLICKASDAEGENIDVWMDNCIELFLSKDKETKSYYQFIVNSNGVKADVLQGNKSSLAWNSGWTAKIAIEEGKCWIAEIKIPKASMPELGGKSIVANFQRHRNLQTEDGVKVGISYYRWRPSKVNGPSGCGILYLEDDGRPRSVVPCGNFTLAPVTRKNRGYIGQYWHGTGENEPIYRDTHTFLTGGGSLLLKDKAGRIRCETSRILKPGTRYRFSYFVKYEDIDASSKFWAYVAISNGSFMPKDRMYGTAPWTRYEYEFTTPKEKWNYALLEFNLRNSKNGKAWVDKVELIELGKAE